MNSVVKHGFCTTMQEGQKCPVCKEEKKYLHQPFKYFDFSVCSFCFNSVETSGAAFYKNNPVFVPRCKIEEDISQCKMDETSPQCKIEEDISQFKMDETSSQNKIEEDTSQCKMDDNALVIKDENIYTKYLIILILVCIACVLV